MVPDDLDRGTPRCHRFSRHILPEHHWHQTPGRLHPLSAASRWGRRQKGRERGAVRAPRSRGRAGRVPVPSSCAAGLGGTLRARSRPPSSPTSSRATLVWRLPRAQFPLLGERSARSYRCWDGALRHERLRPHGAERSGLRPPAGFRLPAAGAAQEEVTVPPGPCSRPQGPGSRGF